LFFSTYCSNDGSLDVTWFCKLKSRHMCNAKNISGWNMLVEKSEAL
jgi:hypothetical protein